MGDLWPPIYDEEQLKKQITRLSKGVGLYTKFFERRPPREGDLCQGDIVELSSGVPLLDETGSPTEDGEFQFWMVIGNTCDLSRSVEDAPWSQLVPLIDLGSDEDIDQDLLSRFQRYRYARRFYVPDWERKRPREHWVAEFPMPVTIAKAGLFNHTRAVARMTREAWILLHSCLVRFLARGDGRET